MKKGLLLLGCVSMLICGSSTELFAQAKVVQQYATKDVPVTDLHKLTPVEAFIMHVKETNQFREVNNIWQPDETFDKTELLKSVSKVQPLTINYTAVANLIQKNSIAISLVVPGINGGTYTIDLAQYSPLHGDFKVYADAGNGDVTQVDYTPGKYYSGVVHGIPGSLAGFSFFKNEVYGIFSIPNVGNFVLVPNSLHGLAYNSLPSYILYNDVDLKILDKAPQCATDRLDLSYRESFTTAAKTTTTLNNNIYQNCKEVNLLEVGDYSYYLTKGSNLTNATNYMSAMMNNQAAVYRNESIILNLKAVKINTATDVYTTLASSSTAYLNAFGDDIQNTYKTTYGCNLAMLVTCMHHGTMGGVAWVGVMCQNYSASSHVDGTAISNIDSNSSLTSAAFPTYSWNVEVLSHEMGHNVGSYHTHACWWNPQYTGTTGIDGCYAVSGGSMDVITVSCSIPTPSTPGSAGGTVMSYCHLVSGVGINFTNGFGPQPGLVIRNYINGTAPAGQDNAPSGCVPSYFPDSASNTINTTVAANRECTDLTSGITYYWNDNNTAAHNDDVLVLMIKKNGNTIGDLNTAGFAVSANTVRLYGTGTGDTINFPAGTSASIQAQSYGMRRYWKITPTTAPTSNVEVMFPFRREDTTDVHGSVPISSAPLASYLMYKANSPTDPNPINGFTGASSSSFSIYTHGTTASTTVWSESEVGTGNQTKLAHMLMTNLGGGGAGFYTFCTPHAQPTLASVPTPPCPGGTATYSVAADVSATSYIWTVAGTGWSGSSTTGTIVVTAGAGVGTISVKAVDSCGAGNAYVFNVTPSPFPTETIAVTTGLCATDATAGFAATVTAGSPVSGYVWSVTGTGWSASGSTTTATFTANAGTGVGVVKVHATNFCGDGPDATLNVSMSNTAPPTPTVITPPALVCPSSTGTFTTPAISGASSYTWVVAGTGWSGTSSTTSVLANIGTGTGTFSVSATNSCGTSPYYTRSVITSTGPGAATAITGPAAPCAGTSITLTTPAVPTASSYTWVVTGTGWSGSSSTGSITLTVGSGPAIVTVNPVNTCGPGGAYTTTVTPAPAPISKFDLSSHITPTHADVVALFSGVAPAGATYAWSFPGGIASPGTGSGAQFVHWNTAGQYLIFLTVSNGAGCSSAYADTVHVDNAAGVKSVNIAQIETSIVPNPNNGVFDILFSEAINMPVSVKLFDMQGRVVYNSNFTDARDKKLTIQTDNLAKGTYTATIYVNEYTISKKITIYR